MATNRKHAHGYYLDANKSNMTFPGSNVASNDPVLFGARPGAALLDEDSNGDTTIQCNGVYEMEVTGQDSAGAVELSPGSIIYMQADGSLDGNDGGTRWGYTRETVPSGTTQVVETIIGY